MENNLSKQVDEIEALVSIYGKDFQVEDELNRKYSIKISGDTEKNNLYVILYVQFPDSYPSASPPMFEISAPHLKQEGKSRLSLALQNIYLSYIGESVIFQWIEKIREELLSFSSQSDSISKKKSKSAVLKEVVEPDAKIENDLPCPEIIHGEVIMDRKSSFQGHTAVVNSVDQVRLVLKKLKEIRKIETATHNIYAYRIYNESNQHFIHDCEDDGEQQAGSRLLHLLEVVDVKNIIVIVTRWYGGIHLGPDRFRHINNAARQVLNSANLLPNSKK